MAETTEQEEYSLPPLLVEELLPRDVFDVWLIMCIGQQFADPEVRKYISKIRKSPVYQCWITKTLNGAVSFLIYRLDHSQQTFVITDFGIYREFDDYRLGCLLDKSLKFIHRRNSSYIKMSVEIKKTNPLINLFFEKGFKEDSLAQQFYEEYSDDNFYLMIEP